MLILKNSMKCVSLSDSLWDTPSPPSLDFNIYLSSEL